MTFEQYIKLNCKKDCIDPIKAFNATDGFASYYAINQKRLLAIMKVESGYRINARNGDSVGLMQVNLHYHGKRFNHSPFNERNNIAIGSDIYRQCTVKHKGDVMKSLRCYNGENSKNFDYSLKVIKAYNEISQLIDFQ